jgi:hypothetical protein
VEHETSHWILFDIKIKKMQILSQCSSYTLRVWFSDSGIIFLNHGNLVSRVAGQGLDGWGSNLGTCKVFFPSHYTQTNCGVDHISYPIYTRECKGNFSHTPGVKVKNMWNFSSIHYVFLFGIKDTHVMLCYVMLCQLYKFYLHRMWWLCSDGILPSILMVLLKVIK